MKINKYQYDDFDNVYKKLSTLLFLLIISLFKNDTIIISLKYNFFM